jgi:deferrochelatase/peroxidase EfeB
VITRRQLLERAAAAGLFVAGVGTGSVRAATAPLLPQAGIAMPRQRRLEFAAFDVVGGPDEFHELLRIWTEVSRKSSSEAMQTRLTATIGFGPSLFDRSLGLAAERPAELIQIPQFRGDRLEPGRSGGDLGLQVCADDAGVARALVDELTGAGVGVVSKRWQQEGFVPLPTMSRSARTPRNLLGFRDGTNNIRPARRGDMARFVWAAQPAWMAGGTYLVTRRIRMRFNRWSALAVRRQERVIGRRKGSGAPLGGRRETEPPDLTARNPRGRLTIPPHAHIRLASPSGSGRTRLLRRSYSYDDGTTPSGRRDAGLFFISFQRDPSQFVAVQRSLTEGNDALLDYVVHESSAVFACPAAARPGGFVGEGLFGAS